MIQWIKDLFKSKDKEKKVDILTILSNKYNEYGFALGVIYVTEKEYNEYIEYIWKHLHHPHRTDLSVYNPEYIGIKVEIDPAILRDEKLEQLLNEGNSTT